MGGARRGGAQAGLSVNFFSGHGDDALAYDCLGIIGIGCYDDITSFVIGKQLQMVKVSVR